MVDNVPTPSDILSRFNERAHAKRMADALVPRYLDLLELAWNEQADRFPVLGAWDVKNPAVQRTVKNLAKRVTGMAATTKDDIRGVLERVFDAETTPGTDVIARALREAGTTSSKSRSEMIARTETATAYNHGAIVSYQEAGVERVEILDSDNDEECAARNGKVVTLDEALAIEPHPNCVMAFAPVVD